MKFFKRAISIAISTSLVLSASTTMASGNFSIADNTTVEQMQERITVDMAQVLKNSKEIALREAIVKRVSSEERNQKFLGLLIFGSFAGMFAFLAKDIEIAEAKSDAAWQKTLGTIDQKAAANMNEVIQVLGKEMDERVLSDDEISKRFFARLETVSEKFNVDDLERARRELGYAFDKFLQADGKTYRVTTETMKQFLSEFESQTKGMVHSRTFWNALNEAKQKLEARRLKGIFGAFVATLAVGLSGISYFTDDSLDDEDSEAARIIRMYQSGDHAGADRLVKGLIFEIGKINVENSRLQAEILVLEKAINGKAN